uniref:Uncharacterized protein n=1 Tax=Myoviridae sp. ct5ra14 TaxID=2827659 RepID=A0A8S5T354_9CAUD|nr:MAG TPA: hypothetical protein [Myoviridae sp. ct5ra14]
MCNPTEVSRFEQTIRDKKSGMLNLGLSIANDERFSL